MSLSSNAVNRLKIATGDVNAGNEIANAVNQGAALKTSHGVVGAIVATATSTTTDFASLKVGDIVATIPAAAGNSKFGAVATAGTAPFAAVIGDLYLVLRPVTYPKAQTKGL